MGIMVLIVLVLVYELLAYRREHRQLSHIHELRRQAMSLDNALRKNGFCKRKHSRHLRGLS